MASMNEKDYYAILEVEQDASTEEIRRAFQKKARKLHPDVNKEPDAEDRFKEVSEAYAVLSDEGKRKRYDAMRSGSPFVGGGYPGGAPGDGSPFGGGFPFGGSWSGTRSSSRSYRPRAGADVPYTIDLDVETASKGTRRGVTYQRFVACDACGGQGSVEHAEASTCPTCAGAGHIRVDLNSIFGFGYLDVTCPECEGSGKVVVDPCTVCGGTGRVLTATELVFEVPPHSHDREVVRVKDMGNAGTNGRESGDFVCEIHVAEERLTPRQESGMRLAGMGLPVLILGLVRSSPSHMSVILGGIMVAIGLAIVISGGLRANVRWWGQAGTALISGAVTGIVIALLLWFLSPGILLMPITFVFLIIILISLVSRRGRN